MSEATKTPKYKSLEEAETALTAAKDAVNTSKTDLETFLQDNKLKKNHDYSKDEDPKIAKGYTKRVTAYTEARADRDSIKEDIKLLTPKKERVVKYDYPADIVGNAKEMKKFRTKQRNAAKKEKAEADGTAKPAKEKAKAEVAAPPAEEGKKKDKKKPAED